jgi:hypothetical protein
LERFNSETFQKTTRDFFLKRFNPETFQKTTSRPLGLIFSQRFALLDSSGWFFEAFRGLFFRSVLRFEISRGGFLKCFGIEALQKTTSSPLGVIFS